MIKLKQGILNYYQSKAESTKDQTTKEFFTRIKCIKEGTNWEVPLDIRGFYFSNYLVNTSICIDLSNNILSLYGVKQSSYLNLFLIKILDSYPDWFCNATD